MKFHHLNVSVVTFPCVQSLCKIFRSTKMHILFHTVVFSCLIAFPIKQHSFLLGSFLGSTFMEYVECQEITMSVSSVTQLYPLFVTQRTAARQASLSITNSQSLLKLMSIVSVMPSNHLILCRPLLLLPSIFPSIRVFSNESVLCIR